MKTFNIMEVLQFIHKMNKGCEIGIYYQGQSEPEVINLSSKQISGISFFPDYFKVDDSTVICYDIISYISTDCYVWNNMYRCIKCGAPVDANRYRCSEEMTQRCLCFHCNFWAEHIQRDHNEDKDVFVVANGKHYIIDESSNTYFKGFGGAKFTIRFNDGRVVKTNNLWFQGDIPESFRDELPDNAVLVDGWED